LAAGAGVAVTEGGAGADVSGAVVGVAAGAAGAAGAAAAGAGTGSGVALVAAGGGAEAPPSSLNAWRHPDDTVAMFFCKQVNTAGPRGTLEQSEK